MKRFSAREFALLCVPVAVVAGAGFWASRRGAPNDNGIAVVAARKIAVTPAVVAKGANVMARVELEPTAPGFLRTSQSTNWNTNVRVRAGDHLLWSNPGNNAVTVWQMQALNTDYLYEAGFDLKKVPADWGEVVLEWDAEFLQSGRDLGRNWKSKSQRAGTIVLRREGETIPKPVISTDSHLKLVSSQIESSGAVFHYITLKFEPDSKLTEDDLDDINFDFALHNPKTKLISWSYGSKGTRIRHSVWSESHVHSYAYTVQVYYDISVAKGFPNTNLDWKSNSRTYWPLFGTIPVTDNKGKILLGKKQYR